MVKIIAGIINIIAGILFSIDIITHHSDKIDDVQLHNIVSLIFIVFGAFLTYDGLTDSKKGWHSLVDK